jgi:hypothetical protein
MKSLTTIIVASAALSSPGTLSVRSQEATATQPLAALAAVQQDEQDLANALAEVQRQVEVELRPRLAAAAAGAGAKVQAAQRQVEQQVANARQAIELAQAAAPPAPRAATAGASATPGLALQQRLHTIVNKGRGGPGKALVIRTSDADAKAQANLEEDLAVMSRILDKTVSKKMDDDGANRFMSINVLFAPGSGSIRNLYLEGYGALFLLNVNFPLLPPPEKPEPTKEKSETDSTWEEAKQELYGQYDAWAPVGKSLKFSMSAGPQQEYDKDKVDDLKESLLEALKNATNIRNLKADESIIVCVFGGVSAAPGKPGKARTWVKRAPNAPDADLEDVLVTERDDGPPARGTIMTMRVKKSDADAFAKGKLNLDDFRKKASITTYAGDTGGWGGGFVFGTP